MGRPVWRSGEILVVPDADASRRRPWPPGEPQAPVQRSAAGSGATGWRHVVGIVVVVFALFPIVFVISSSLNPQGTLTGSNALFSEIGLDSYVRILTNPEVPFTAWFANTLIIAGITAVGTVFLGALAAYSFSRMRFTGRRVGLISIVVSRCSRRCSRSSRSSC